MKADRISLVVSLLVVFGLVLAACGPTPEPTQPPPTEAPVATEAPAATEVPATEVPSTEGTPYKVGFCAAITGPGRAWECRSGTRRRCWPSSTLTAS